MDIRKLKKEDSNSILKLLAADYEEVKSNLNYGVILRLKKPSRNREVAWAKDLQRELAKGDIVYNVAIENGNVIGICYAAKSDIPDSEASHVGILGLEIDKRHRGNRVGTKLLGYTLDSCRNKFEIIEARVFTTNEAAKNLYRKFGFKTWGIAPGYVKRGRRYIDMEYMYLKL